VRSVSVNGRRTLAYERSVVEYDYTNNSLLCKTCRILKHMTLITRSVTIQVRVVPLIKQASEQVLSRIGLNMSEAVELFLRRVIVEERIPFEVVALGETPMKNAVSRTYDNEPLVQKVSAQSLSANVGDSNFRKKRHRHRKKLKKISGGHTLTGIGGGKTNKKGTI
jgi:addiction module RelB/DinJ family antitoxin